LRVLITGATGFAGSHLVRTCLDGGDDVVALVRDREAVVPGASVVVADLLSAAAVREAVAAAAPEVIYHLAALSSVGRSWEDPATTLSENTASAVNVLQAARSAAPSARVVWVSSNEVYGKPAALPVTEDALLTPENPYAISKAAGDMLARLYAEALGLDLVRVRPFNHAGPGQLPIFLLSSLSQQGAQARLDGVSSVRIVTGNPDARRDFTDVRDVVRAYRLLAASTAAGVFNVASGRSVSAREQVSMLASLLDPITVEHHVDPARVRAHEVMDVRGSTERLHAATGWEPAIPLRQTMADTIAWWEAALSTGTMARASPA
jgi:GDP-4-dehydro-6-deoxy-D-mannose reductase